MSYSLGRFSPLASMPSTPSALTLSPSASSLPWATTALLSSSSAGWWAYSSSLKPWRRMESKLLEDLRARPVELKQYKKGGQKGSQALLRRQASILEKYQGANRKPARLGCSHDKKPSETPHLRPPSEARPLLAKPCSSTQ